MIKLNHNNVMIFKSISLQFNINGGFDKYLMFQKNRELPACFLRLMPYNPPVMQSIFKNQYEKPVFVLKR
jgi:hypothetical protein